MSESRRVLIVGTKEQLSRIAHLMRTVGNLEMAREIERVNADALVCPIKVVPYAPGTRPKHEDVTGIYERRRKQACTMLVNRFMLTRSASVTRKRRVDAENVTTRYRAAWMHFAVGHVWAQSTGNRRLNGKKGSGVTCS